MRLKTPIRISLPRLLATIALGLLLAGRVGAQTCTALHAFGDARDGANPFGDLVLAGNTLYGTTSAGGTNGSGMVFAVNTDGTRYANLYSFSPPQARGGWPDYTLTINFDGDHPNAGLVLSGGTLFGTATSGGSNNFGTVFVLNTDGTGYTVLHTFSGDDGGVPNARLLLAGNTLYGTTAKGGSNGVGTVFAINTDGTGFTNLHYFTTLGGSGYPSGNSQNFNSPSHLILSGNTLYGTTDSGGVDGYGTVYALNTDGSGYTNLISFTGDTGDDPNAGLLLLGSALYGETMDDGINGDWGTVFALNTDGTGFAVLHAFGDFNQGVGNFVDGYHPCSDSIASDHTLYGTAPGGGVSQVQVVGPGTIFALNTDGTSFTNIYSFFAGSSGGGWPRAGLILSGTTFYGTTTAGGIGPGSGNGTVFSLSFPPPQLTISVTATNVNLAWPDNIGGFSYSGFALQSTASLAAPNWVTVAEAASDTNCQ